MLCLWSRRGVWGNSDAELAVKQEAPHLSEGRSQCAAQAHVLKGESPEGRR